MPLLGECLTGSNYRAVVEYLFGDFSNAEIRLV